MPKVKTKKAAAKRFKENESLQEPYSYKEDNKEKEKFKTCSYDRCNKCKDNEEDYALSLI